MIQRVKHWSDWILAGALASSLIIDICAYVDNKRRARIWDRAMAEDLAKATADGAATHVE